MKRMIMSIALMTALCFTTGVSAQSNNVAVKACKKECQKACDGKKVQEKAACATKACDEKVAATGQAMKKAECCKKNVADKECKKACAKADCKKKAECAKASVKADCKKAAECKGKACGKMKK